MRHLIVRALMLPLKKYFLTRIPLD